MPPAPYLLNPLELPVAQTAAQAFTTAFPDQVTQEATLNPDRITQANAALASTDPRKAGQGSGGSATATAVAPTSGAHGTAVPITITGTNLTTARKVNVGKDCTKVVVVSATSITCTTSASVAAGAQTVKISFSDMSTLTGPTYTYT